MSGRRAQAPVCSGRRCRPPAEQGPAHPGTGDATARSTMWEQRRTGHSDT